MGYTLRLFTSPPEASRVALKAVPDAKGDSDG